MTDPTAPDARHECPCCVVNRAAAAEIVRLFFDVVKKSLEERGERGELQFTLPPPPPTAFERCCGRLQRHARRLGRRVARRVRRAWA